MRFGKTSIFHFFLLISLAGTTSLANAQVSVLDRFYLPDGKTVPASKLDSIDKAWGGYYFMKMMKGDSVRTYIKPVDEGMKREMTTLSHKQDSMVLHSVGTVAPPFTLKDIDGVGQTLRRHRGKVVVLNFWFTACVPCVKEMPQLNELSTRYSDKSQVVFLALTFDDSASVRKFLMKHSFTFTPLVNSKAVDKRYAVSSWPTNIVIDRNGKISFRCGYDDNIVSVLSEAINKVL